MPMNAYELLRQNANIGRVRLGPSALSLHPTGPALHDDLWWIEGTPPCAVRIHNITTNHFKDLAPSDVLSVEVDPHAPQSGLVYLRVRLTRQLWLRGADAGWVSPNGPVRRNPRVSRQQQALFA